MKKLDLKQEQSGKYGHLGLSHEKSVKICKNSFLENVGKNWYFTGISS